MRDDDLDDLLPLSLARELCSTGEARQLLEGAHLTSVDVARVIGVTKDTVHRWVTRERRPSNDVGTEFGRLLLKLKKATNKENR